MLHEIILTNYPIKRNYRVVGPISIDKNLREVGDAILQTLPRYGISHLSLKNNVIVEGRSWEMAAVKSLINIKGVFSGTLESADDEFVFGNVPGEDIKRLVYNDVIVAK